jgi:flagellar motor protein MotB
MDPVKHKMVNYGVSVNRADKIANELRKMGVEPESIIVDARSDSMPLYYEIMPSGEAGNRRAEIYFNN